jgi:TetR/AcrR family transcriptional regulator, fatty acid metabolism regulator protein
MRTRTAGTAGGAATFTQRKRRDQLVDCAIDAIVDVGYQRASVAEVARRAGVSKGVVTYHFPAKDDLIQAVIADVIAEMAQYLGPRWRAADPERHPERFIAAYIAAWTGYIQAHGRQVLALVRVYNSFRDEAGLPNPAFDARATEVAVVTQILRLGQEAGRLRRFDPAVMAAVMKAALDDLLTQYSDNPGLDLEAYGAELIAMFEAATSPHAAAASQADLASPEEEQ